MIKYGVDRITELKFASFQAYIERRNEQLVDIVLRLTLTPDSEAPDDLIDFTALVICTVGGQIAQIIPQDEDCDCEYQFTASEKEQIAAYVQGAEIQAEIARTSSPL
jgi:hypothetical protein